MINQTLRQGRKYSERLENNSEKANYKTIVETSRLIRFVKLLIENG